MEMEIVMAYVTLGAYAALIIGGIILLIFRVWDLGVWLLTIGLGIPALVLLVIAGILSEWWSFGLGGFILLALSGIVQMLLVSNVPGRPVGRGKTD